MRYILMLLLLSGCHEYLGERVEATIGGYTDKFEEEERHKPKQRRWIKTEGECPYSNYESMPLEYYFAEGDVLVINMKVFSRYKWRRKCYDGTCYMFRYKHYAHHLMRIEERIAPIATCVNDKLVIVVFEDGTFTVTVGGYNEAL